MFSNFPGWSLILIYIILAVAIVFLSMKCANYVDALDKKTKISGAFIGGVLLAAVTSLPELFTSLSATILIPTGSEQLVVGNILGSNLFNLAIIGFCLLFFCKSFVKSKFEFKSHFVVLIGVGVIYALISYGLFVPSKAQPILGPINFIAVAILIVYGIDVYFQPKEKEDGDEEEKEDPYAHISLKQVIIRFIICAVLLVAVSILITYDTDALSAEYNIDKSVAGAIFLAIATSLPELVSTITLCKKGNFNAGLGDIIGSCLFNFCIIGLAEFMSFRTSLLPGADYTNGFINMPDIEAIYMAIITMVILVFLSITLIIRSRLDKKGKESKTGHKIFYIISGVFLLAGYFVFLIL